VEDVIQQLANSPSATKVSPDCAKDVARCSKTPNAVCSVQETSSDSSGTSSDDGTDSANSKRVKTNTMSHID